MEKQMVFTIIYSETFGGKEFMGVYDSKGKVKEAILEHMALVENVNMEDDEEIQETMDEEYIVYESELNEANYAEML